MNRIFFLLLALVLPISIVIAQDEAPKRAWVRGTNVSLLPPIGWGPAAEFPGYLHEASTSSVMITEIPAPYSELLKGFSNEAELKKRGMTLLTSEERKMGQHPGVLLTLTQSVGEITIKKTIWIFGSPKQSVFAMGTVLAENADDWFEVTTACVKSCFWDLSRVVNPFEGTGFELTDTQDLLFALKVTDMLVFTEDGKVEPKQKGKLMFMMGPALGSGPIADKEAFAEQRLRQFPIEIVEIESKVAIEIDGLKGFELVATTQVDKQARIAHTVILFEEDNYWVSFAEARVEVRESALEKFKTIARSFQRVQPTVEETEPEPDRK